MSSVKETINRLQQRLSENSTYSYWLKFTAGKLELDTSTNKNLFISFQNVKSGVKKANCFTLNIAYVPSILDPGGESIFGNINYIDKCLAEDEKLACTLQYGYDLGPDNLTTPKYNGMITNFSKEVNNGMLYYTITGYSNVIENIEDKISVDTTNKKIRATTFAAQILESKIDNYTIKIDDSAFEKDEEQIIEGATDVCIFEYVDTVLKRAIDSETKNNEAHKMAYYTYVVDDINKEIRIVRIDSKTYKSTDITFDWMSNSNSIVISFKPNYNGYILSTYYKDVYKEMKRSNTIVGVFSSIMNSISSSIISALSIFKIPVPPVYNKLISSSGKLEESNESNSNPEVPNTIKEDLNVSITAVSDAMIEKAAWAEAIKRMTFTATLVTVGIPYDIPILSKFTINPIINTQKDMSAGDYMATQVVDNIDSSGFTTTMELMKIGEFDD